MRPLLPLLFVLGSSAVAQEPQSPFCARLQAITVEPTQAAAHWGISVTTLSGVSLCRLNDAQLFRPASTAKLFTTIAALGLMDGTGTAETRLAPAPGATLQAGTSQAGILHGDLVLEGRGDAFLSDRAMPYKPGPAAGPKPVNPLETMADTVAAQGMQRVTGDLIGDDTYFPYEPYGADWSVGDMLWGYGAPVSALTVADNKVALRVVPGASAGAPAVATLDQMTPYYTLTTSVTTVAAHAPAAVLVERRPGSRVVRVTGTVAAGAAYAADLAIEDPALYAALALKDLLAARGVQVEGVARARHREPTETRSLEAQENAPATPQDGSGSGPFPALPARSASTDEAATALATHTSATLLADITLTLKVSQNLHAELLLHRLGRLYGEDGSTAQGCRVVRQFLLWHHEGEQRNQSADGAGLNPQDFSLNDGSGLSTQDLVAPRAFTSLLTYAARQPWFAAFKAALPVAATDGTLAARFTAPASALKGRVFAKTGTLGESRALTGYVVTRSRQTLAFAILEDTHRPGGSAAAARQDGDRAAMDRMVELIAAAD